jgi:hypothetical protein
MYVHIIRQPAAYATRVLTLIEKGHRVNHSHTAAAPPPWYRRYPGYQRLMFIQMVSVIASNCLCSMGLTLMQPALHRVWHLGYKPCFSTRPPAQHSDHAVRICKSNTNF